MSVGQQDKRLVPMSMSPHLGGGLHQGVYFIWFQVFPGTPVCVLAAAGRGNFPILGGWRTVPSRLQCHDIAHTGILNIPKKGHLWESILTAFTQKFKSHDGIGER
ncbi:MAG: hypothetical protein WCC11_04225 [Gammaproteobacteria bacterium]